MSNQLDHKVITLNNRTITINPKQRLISANILEYYDIPEFEIGYTYGNVAFATIDEQKHVKEAYLKEFCTNTGHRYIDVFNLIPKVETMSSLEIAKLTGKQHKNIMADIKNMLEQLYMQPAEFSASYKAGNGQMQPCYNLNEELTITLTSGYSIPQRNAIIKKWQAHRRGEVVTQSTTLTIPQTLSDALSLAANLAEEKEHLQQERDEAVRTKHLISDRKVATALGTAGNLAKSFKDLEANVKYKNPYQMRHTFISMLLQFGNSLIVIYKMVGHNNTEMIYKNYARFIQHNESKKLLKFF